MDGYQRHCSGVGNGADAVQHLINNLQEQAERAVGELVPDTELGEEEAVDVLEGRAALQTNNLGHGLTGTPTLAKASVPGTGQPRATGWAGLGSSTAEKTQRSWWTS